MIRLNARIAGMHCSGCALTVERALRQLTAVRSVVVNHRSGLAEIEAEPELACGELEDVLRSAGFELRELIRG